MVCAARPSTLSTSMEAGMTKTQEHQGGAPSSTDYDAALAGQDQHDTPARPPLKSQAALTLKVFFAWGAAMLTLWLIDYAVAW